MTDEKGDKDRQEQSANASSDQLPDSTEKGAQLVGDTTVNKSGIKVHPQPTSDPLDPLNWSSLQKHVILAIVMLKYAVCNYITFCSIVRGLIMKIHIDTFSLHISQRPPSHPSRKSRPNTRSATLRSTGLLPSLL